MDYYKDFVEEFVETSFGKICCMHHKGPGSTVIFLHGLGATSRVWKRLMQYMPENLDIYLLDLLGHGRSDAPQMEYTLSKQVQVINEVVEDRMLENCFMFGHSYGGWIAVTYSLDNTVAKGFIFEDAAGFRDYFDDLRNDRKKFDRQRKRVREELAYSNAGNTRVFDNILGHESDDYEFTEEDLHKISRPTLIIWGKEDDMTEYNYAQVMNKNIKDSMLVIVDGAKHTPHYTHPQEVAKVLLEFIGQ